MRGLAGFRLLAIGRCLVGRGLAAISPIPPLPWTFGASDWTLTPSTGQPRITITAADGDFDDVLYSVNGGEWVSSGIDAVGGYLTLTGAALPVSIRIRPEYEGARGPASPVKTAALPVITGAPSFVTLEPIAGTPIEFTLAPATGGTVSLYSLMLDEVDVSGDVSGSTVTVDAGGILTLVSAAENEWGAVYSEPVSIAVALTPIEALQIIIGIGGASWAGPPPDITITETGAYWHA